MRNRVLFAAIALGLGLAAARPVSAAEPDPAHGRVLAQRLCVSCHVVEGAGTDAAPTLAALAREKSDASLRLATASPHHAYMPPLDLSQPDIGDLVAYLRTLRRHP
ncbi:MAG: c-type cytochrome [Magnetospirillum sp.]|nr:c-type cytochrome [Magnetospirillum sp.]